MATSLTYIVLLVTRLLTLSRRKETLLGASTNITGIDCITAEHLGFAVEILTNGPFTFVLLPISRTWSVSAHVAQLGECLTEYVKVLGSIPSVGRMQLW